MAKHGGSTAAAHKKHPKGQQTGLQLAAERKNLVKARAALAKKKKNLSPAATGTLINYAAMYDMGKASPLNTAAKKKAKKVRLTRAQREGIYAGRRTVTLSNLRGKHHPLGVTELAFNNSFQAHLLHKVTGLYRKEPARIAPTSVTGRGGWKQSRTHHRRKRLYLRKVHVKRVSHWHKRKSVYQPR